MSDKKKESLFVVSYSGRDTADQAYDTLRVLEKDHKIDIKTAATVQRKDNGKLKLKHRRAYPQRLHRLACRPARDRL